MDISALIDRINELLLKPEIFWYFLGGLAGSSFLVILMYVFQSKRQSRSQEDEKAMTRQYWEKQLKEYVDKNNELSKTIHLLKSQIENKEKETASLDRLKEELSKKDESLRNETLAKEKIWVKAKDAENQLIVFKKNLESKEEDLGACNRLISRLQDELKAAQEVYNGLKEQYADLELQLDAINQSFALEKSLHSRLKEEHAQCPKPSSD